MNTLAPRKKKNKVKTKDFLKLASSFEGYNIDNLGKIHFNS